MKRSPFTLTEGERTTFFNWENQDKQEFITVKLGKGRGFQGAQNTCATVDRFRFKPGGLFAIFIEGKKKDALQEYS